MSDLEEMHEWISNSETMRFISWKTNSIQETSKQLRESIQAIAHAKRKIFNFAIVLKDQKRIIGDVGFTILNQINSSGIADCGYFLNKNFWGNGYATEAYQTMIEYVFTELNLHKLTAGCIICNEASQNVMRKCNMIQEAKLKQHQYYNGKWYDRLLYGLLKKDWDKLIK